MVPSMDRDGAIAKLKEAEAGLEARGVVHAAMSGSLARGEHTPSSDTDVMVEIDPARHGRMDVFDDVGIVHVIEELVSSRRPMSPTGSR